MRTTIELSDEARARLLELAARRGLKGYSRLIQEAVDLYLEELERAQAARVRALGLRGALAGEEAEALRTEAERVRASWR